MDISLDTKLKSLEQSFETQSRSVTDTIESRLGLFSTSMGDSAAQVIQSIESRLGNLTSSLTDGTAQAIEALDRRIAGVTDTISSRSTQLTDTISARFQEIHQGIETRVGSIAKGKTHMPSRDEAKALIAAIDTDSLVGIRDRAVIGRLDPGGKRFRALHEANLAQIIAAAGQAFDTVG